MTRTLRVAYREFASTAFTKSFMFGFFVMPIIIFVGVAGATVLFNRDGPKVQGTVAVIDQSPGGKVAEGLRSRFTPERDEQEAKEQIARVQKAAEDSPLGPMARQAWETPQAQMALQQAMPRAAITLEVLAPDTDVKAEQARVLADSARRVDGAAAASQRLALVVIPAGSVTPAAPVKPGDEGAFEAFQLHIRPKLDPQVQNRVRDKVRESLIDARLDAAGFAAERDRLRAMITQPRSETNEVTKEGVKKSNAGLAFLMPMAFMVLLWMSVFTAGQYLLTTTIEEKSSRVMEVLLSAVSSRELLIGKIIGQMAVGLLVLGLYGGLGVGSLFFTKTLSALDPLNLVYLAVFFLIAYALVASMMAAIGSAVSDMREAQSLMTPVMLILMVPMVLWMPISRDPNGMFSTIASMTPPLSPFVMVLRIPAAAGSIPVPLWQIAVSIALGLASVVFVAWAAAKIFRVGVLMYGKPPNLGTLIKWVRMA